MTELKLRPLKLEEKEIFIKDIQEAFQKAYVDVNGELDEPIIPREDIEEAFAAEGSEAYFAVLDGQVVGGTVVTINPQTQHNHLDLLYVKVGGQNRGLGQQIWQAIEVLYPETKVWETDTPYFDKRNLHFYINRCGFKVVEFYNANHMEPGKEDKFPEEGSEFFRFEKVMK